jgi:hypothetical protein
MAEKDGMTAVKQLGEHTMCRKNVDGMRCFQGMKEEIEEGWKEEGVE